MQNKLHACCVGKMLVCRDLVSKKTLQRTNFSLYSTLQNLPKRLIKWYHFPAVGFYFVQNLREFVSSVPH